MGDIDDLDDNSGGANAPYGSVIYFHGMGSQRRYEETSRLIDRLDQFIRSRFNAGLLKWVLVGIKAKSEESRARPGTTIGYIETIYPAPTTDPENRTVRFYEVYWAPVMAEQKSMWAVLRWMFEQPLRPWTTLRAAWRERQRLRRATLASLFEKKWQEQRRKGTAGSVDSADYEELMSLYAKFENMEAQRDYKSGSFEEYLAFVTAKFVKDAEGLTGPALDAINAQAIRCQALAKAWRETYRNEELRNFCVLVTFALTLLLAAGAGLFGILVALQRATNWQPVADLLQRWQIPLPADLTTAGTILVALLTLLGFGKFLTDYLGDVQAWATYEETDMKHVARNKVLDQSLDVLTHVLNDERCKRVTVVAHSLGTSVAHDALLALKRRNSAYVTPSHVMDKPVPLSKIEHFVTMGSPIDKIEYLFESYASDSHRYKRVIETLRGDIGTPPFSRKDTPHVHWVNFWDQGDIISGPLHSPASGTMFAQRVDNVHIASYHFPDPGKSHGGYFDHRSVIERIFEIIYEAKYSFVRSPTPGVAPNVQAAYLGPGEPGGARLSYLGTAMALPWLLLLGVIALVLQGIVEWAFLPLIAYAAFSLAALAAVILAAGYFASKWRGQLKPIDKP